MESSFFSDLKKEKQLALLIDAYYKDHLVYYDTERVADAKHQMAGVDVIFTHKSTKDTFYIDEKAQLDYINEDLPTFAFELSYLKKGVCKEGWLFDPKKKTDFYALITAIYQDEPTRFTTCNITLVNRKKLQLFLEGRKMTKNVLTHHATAHEGFHGKLKLAELQHRKEGYLYFSRSNKAEKPINLVLKLAFLIDEGIAKRLV
ncbi:MAG: hypothetical protein WA810_01815 [Maribacter sp.]